MLYRNMLILVCSFSCSVGFASATDCEESDNMIAGETASYSIAYGEKRHSIQFSLQEASASKFQWLRNPAANQKAYERGTDDNWPIAGDGSINCTVAMATGDYESTAANSSNFKLYPNFNSKEITMNTSEYLMEFEEDGDNLVRLMSGLGGKANLVDNVYTDNENRGIKITSFGTSTLLFEDENTRLLIDGFFTRPSIPELAVRRNRPDVEVLSSVIDNFNWAGDANGNNAIDAIIPMHAHHDHAMDIPFIADQILSSGGTVKLISDESVRNIMRGYAIEEHRDGSHFDEIYSGAAEDGQSGKVYRVGDFEVTLMKTIHAPIPSIVDWMVGRGAHIIDIIVPNPGWWIFDFNEGDAFTALIKHPKGNFMIYLGGKIENTTPLLDEDDQPIQLDTVFFSAGGTLETWESADVETFIRNWIKPSNAPRVIPIHWDSQFRAGENKFYSDDRIYGDGIKLLKSRLTTIAPNAKLKIAPLNTFWYENHN